MATITSDTFLDGGVARTAGEAWTMNGGVLTIRTDTRWHANAPASMTGSIGATTTSATLGGGVLIDGRNVRQLAYNSGSGNVPAIGTTITQGGVTGYLLAVYANMTSAPTAVGAAMPSTGFIKFREVTGGAFAAGALSGIGASATGADVVGWIEIVQDQAVANTVPRLGFFRTRGDWYELGVTSGSAAQTFQVPTNGGGAGTHVPTVWIETAPGSGEYESYPALLAAAMIPANLGTDERSKFVQTMGNGEVRIGNNGTNNVGFVPPSGCRVRIPNVLGRQCATGSRATNQVPNATLATRPDFTTTSAGDIDFENFMNDWYHLFASPFRVRMINCATFDIHSTSNEASPTDIDNYAIGGYNGTSIPLVLLSNPLGGTIKNSKFPRVASASNGHVCTVTTSADYIFQNCHFGVITYARSTGRSIATSQCLNILFEDIYQYNAYTQHTTSFNITHVGIDHCDRYVGDTNGTTGMYAVAVLTSSNNIKVDGLTFGLKGTLSGYHNPFLSPFYSINSSNVTFRNAGTRSAPLAVASAALGPQYAVHDAGVNTNLLAQRIYVEHTRTSAFLTVNTSKNSRFESIHGTVGSLQTLSLNTLVKGVRATSNSVTGGASVYGTHVFDMFTGDTDGRLWFAMNEPTAFSADYVTLTLAGSTGGFTSGGQVSMPTVGDEIIIEMPYYALGITALANAAPTLTGTQTGNFTYEYAIDTGSGFGAYQTLNGANLSAETINPAVGFKLRLRVTTATANTTNALTYVRINTESTLAAQTNNLYPLDLATISITGFAVGTRVQIFNLDTNEEVYNEIAVSNISISVPYTDDENYRVRAMFVQRSDEGGIFATKFMEVAGVLTVNGLAVNLSPEADAVYIANGIDGEDVVGITIDDSALLVNVDTGLLTLQELYAYETYWLQTEEGIRDEQRFINAIDQANYSIENFKIKNVSSPTEPLVITNGYAKDSVTGEAIDVIDTSGGTIFMAPDRVVPFTTSGGGGGDTKEEIYTYFTSSGRQNTFRADVSAIPTNPLLTNDARLNNLDATISSRLAAVGYIAPANSDISAIKAKTDTLVNTDLTGIATSVEIATLPSDVADAVWDEAVASHTIAGSAGKELSDTKKKAALAAALSA
jgi:hypothetical protein